MKYKYISCEKKWKINEEKYTTIISLYSISYKYNDEEGRETQRETHDSIVSRREEYH